MKESIWEAVNLFNIMTCLIIAASLILNNYLLGIIPLAFWMGCVAMFCSIMSLKNASSEESAP